MSRYPVRPMDLQELLARPAGQPRRHVLPTRAALEVAAARELARAVTEAAEARGRCGLGLATGATQIGVYRELVDLHRAGAVSFAACDSFNLDEFWPLERGAPGSFGAFMEEHLFRAVDLAPERRHLPASDVPAAELVRHCVEYEAGIRAVGGLDVQLLGIGTNGHVAFNEPGALPGSRTRLVTLEPETQAAQAPEIAAAPPPVQAITMGIGTILEADHLVLVAAGGSKAAAVRAALEEAPSAAVPASWIRLHPRVDVFLDEAAASELQAPPTA